MGKNMENMEQDLAGLNVVNDTSDVFSKVKRHGKYVYSRDFLMSFACLEHCKSQPTGIDPVLLRSNSPESIDGMITIAAKSSRGLIQRESDNCIVFESHLDLPEWRRSSSFKNEFPANNSSPRLRPNWGDNGTGKNNSSGQRNQLYSDGDSADPSGRIHGGGLSLVHARDGLLGSGGPISPHGGLSPIHRVDRPHTSGRAGDQCRLHTAKASSFSSKEDSDLVNDETFGSGEGSDEAQAEKEQHRKESFKQMRKEQRNKLRDVGSKSFHGFRENRENDGLTGQSNEGLVSSLLGTPKPFPSRDGIMKGQNKGACIVASPPTTPRPLVPPGFSKVAVQRSLSLKELGHGTMVVHDTANVTTKEIYMKLPSRFNVKEEANTAVGNNDPHSLSKDDDLHPAMSKFSRWFPGEETNFQMSKQRLGSQMGSPEMSSVTSEVESSMTRISLLSEDFDGSESRNRILHGMSSSVASLLPINNEGPTIPMPIGPSLEDVERLLTAGSNGSTSFSSPKSHEGGTSSRSSMMGVLSGVNEKPCSEASPVFLTCEDLEQHLLSNTVSCRIANSDPGDREENVECEVGMSALFQRRVARNNAGQLGHAGDTILDAIDNNASRHIMMLLQKGAPAADDKAVTCENICSLQSNGPDINQLETLFGKTFVSELRHGSAGEPVSAKAPVHPSDLQLQIHDVLPNSCTSVSGFGFRDDIEQKFSHQFPQHNKIEQNGPKDFIGPHIYDASWADLSPRNMVNAGNALILDSRPGEPFAGQFGPSALPYMRHMLHPQQLPFPNGFYSSTHHMFPKAAPHNKYHDSQLWGAQTMAHRGSFVDERSQLSRTDHMTSYNAFSSQAIRMGLNPQITGPFNSIRSIGPLQHGMPTAVPVPEMHGPEGYENGMSFHLDSHFDSHSHAPRRLRSGY